MLQRRTQSHVQVIITGRLSWAEAAKVRERIRRPDFGHLDIEITVDDPKAYTKPWTVTVHQQFASDTELIDEICVEGERFSQKLR